MVILELIGIFGDKVLLVLLVFVFWDLRIFFFFEKLWKIGCFIEKLWFFDLVFLF